MVTYTSLKTEEKNVSQYRLSTSISHSTDSVHHLVTVQTLKVSKQNKQEVCQKCFKNMMNLFDQDD